MASRGGGDIVDVDDYIAEFVVEGNNERAFISMNTQNIVRLEVCLLYTSVPYIIRNRRIF